MKFKISRSSTSNGWYGDPKYGGTYIDNSTVEHHITTDGTEILVHTIEINTLEELLKLVDKYGQIIVGNQSQWYDYTLEIYDDYRENPLTRSKL